MSRLRHAKGLPKMAGALTGVHRLQVDKPHPFKPDEEKKHGGKIHGHEHHNKLGRKRGGSVKKKRDDGGSVTTVAKTNPSNPLPPPRPSDYMSSDDIREATKADLIRRAKDHPANRLTNTENFERQMSRARGGHVGHGHHGTDATPDRGLKFGSHVQGTPMSGTESGYGGKTAFGKGHIEDSLKDGGKVKWIQKMHMKEGAETASAKHAGLSTHGYMEKHKHDSGKAGKRARLGLTLSAMAKHKKHGGD